MTDNARMIGVYQMDLGCPVKWKMVEGALMHLVPGVFQPVDLLYLGTLPHQYGIVSAELNHLSPMVHRYIIVTDTQMKEHDEDYDYGHPFNATFLKQARVERSPSKRGILPAVTDFLEGAGKGLWERVEAMDISPGAWVLKRIKAA
jgi:hypothetical protein